MNVSGIGLRVRGLLAIVATYVFFLLFVQFAFLDLIQQQLGDPDRVASVMAAMGFAGIAASLGTAWILKRVRAPRLLLLGFGGCTISSLGTLFAARQGAGFFWFVVDGGLIGIVTAVVTVTLASSLGVFFVRAEGRPHGTRGAGLLVGVGTGAAYLLSNIPALFEGSVELRSLFAAAMCVMGAVAVWRLPDSQELDARPWISDQSYRAIGFITIILSFLALVWLDSAAFAIIQETPELKSATWGSGGQTLAIGTLHLLGALAAGLWIDRGRIRSILVVTFGLFAVSLTLLEHKAGFAPWAMVLYAIGIGGYSAALVAYPSLGGNRDGVVPTRWRAGLLFALAGWLGSALGVGMAQNLHRIPTWFVAAAGALIVTSGLLSRPRARRSAAKLTRAFVPAIALAGGGFGLVHGTRDRVSRPAAASLEQSSVAAIARGGAVYIREGCINCHSQYVRPGTSDVELWGPYRPVEASETPPLLGNRRLGPDLRNVGNRRSPTWQRLHLENPRALVPDSRMPSYRHLFEGDEADGRDLVAYLSSLGHETARAHYEAVQTTRLQPPEHTHPYDEGQRLFADYCQPCHGLDSRGTGPLADAVYKERSAIDLTKRNFWLVPWGSGAEPEDQALARVVKFGIPKTSMPGHEYLSDQEIADIVAYVQELRRNRTAAHRSYNVTSPGLRKPPLHVAGAG